MQAKVKSGTLQICKHINPGFIAEKPVTTDPVALRNKATRSLTGKPLEDALREAERLAYRNQLDEAVQRKLAVLKEIAAPVKRLFTQETDPLAAKREEAQAEIARRDAANAAHKARLAKLGIYINI